MGYGTRTEGKITVSPRIKWSELREHRDLTGPSRGSERDAYLAVREHREDAEDGESEVVTRYSEEIVTPNPGQEYSRHGLNDAIEEIVAAFPGRTYDGRIVCHGEDGDVWAVTVRKGGAVINIWPRLVWPDEDGNYPECASE